MDVSGPSGAVGDYAAFLAEKEVIEDDTESCGRTSEEQEDKRTEIATGRTAKSPAVLCIPVLFCKVMQQNACLYAFIHAYF